MIASLRAGRKYSLFEETFKNVERKRIIYLIYVFQLIRKMLPAVQFSGVTSLSTPRNTCIGQGHDAGLALSVNVWTVKDRIGNTEIWKEFSVAVWIVTLEITVNRTGRGQQCNIVTHRDEIKLLRICALRIFSHVLC